MIHPNESTTAAVRSVFIIDPDKKIRLTMTYPMNVGRNFDEILRVIDALQLAVTSQGRHPGRLAPGRQGDHPHLRSAMKTPRASSRRAGKRSALISASPKWAEAVATENARCEAGVFVQSNGNEAAFSQEQADQLSGRIRTARRSMLFPAPEMSLLITR
jgi:hypothetical protein